MSLSRRTLLVAGGLAVLLVAAVAWWFSGPAPAEVDIADALEGAATATATADATSAPGQTATPATSSAPASGDASDAAGQEWTVSTDVVDYDFDAPAGTFVGFRIDEELTSVGATTAVARSPEVSGSLVLHDTVIDEAEFTADLTALDSDRRRRNGAIQRALATTTHPDATFVLTEPVTLDAVPPIGEAIEAQATGDLTVHGVTNEVTIPLQAALVDESQLVVTSSFDVTLADWEVTAPSAPAVVSVSNVATVEVQLYFVP